MNYNSSTQFLEIPEMKTPERRILPAAGVCSIALLVGIFCRRNFSSFHFDESPPRFLEFSSNSPLYPLPDYIGFQVSIRDSLLIRQGIEYGEAEILTSLGDMETAYFSAKPGDMIIIQYPFPLKEADQAVPFDRAIQIPRKRDGGWMLITYTNLYTYHYRYRWGIREADTMQSHLFDENMPAQAQTNDFFPYLVVENGTSLRHEKRYVPIHDTISVIEPPQKLEVLLTTLRGDSEKLELDLLTVFRDTIITNPDDYRFLNKAHYYGEIRQEMSASPIPYDKVLQIDINSPDSNTLEYRSNNDGKVYFLTLEWY